MLRCRLIIFILMLGLFAARPTGAQQEIDLERLQRATVFIMQTQDIDGELFITCVGSGTIVRYDGLILTNAHNTLPSDSCPGETLIIATTLRLDEPPVPKYRASIAQADPGIDLALLQIDRELDGRLIDIDDLPALPFADLADSNNVELDQTLTVIGYPGIGSEPIDLTRGTVTGFIAERGAGQKSWIKTSAIIPGTMTGGGAYNAEGQLVGVPTTAPPDVETATTTCLRIEDSTGDGLINNNDICIPIGSFINAIRPSSFARSLIRGASLGLKVATLTTPSFQVAPTERPEFSRLFFSPSVTDGLPSTVVGSLPAGTNNLYLFFDYRNMKPETVYELRINLDGIPYQTFSLPPVRWSGGDGGLWYIGGAEQPWPNGVYEFRLFIDGIAAGNQSIVIGGPPQETQAFSNIAFGLLDPAGNLLGNGYVLPTGSTASARFIYSNMIDGTPWTAIWYYNDILVARTDDTWRSGTSGSQTVNLQPENGLVPGNYRVELYIESRLSATADFVIAGAQQGQGGAFPRVFQNAHFTRADTAQEAVESPPGTSYPDGAGRVYALFDWEQIAPGTLWTMRWSVDNEVFFQQTAPWTASESGSNFVTQLTAPSDLPDGTYRFDLFVNNVQLASESVEVGIGQLPIDRFAQAGGTQLRGQIVDAATNEGIANATFYLISEDFSVGEFVWNRDQLYAIAITDRNGRFEIDRPLQLEAPYSVLIEAEYYLPVSADGFIVTAEDGSPIEMFIPLTQD